MQRAQQEAGGVVGARVVQRALAGAHAQRFAVEPAGQIGQRGVVRRIGIDGDGGAAQALGIVRQARKEEERMEAGRGGAGLGDVNGRVGGTNGGGEGDLFGYGEFAGEIALLRYYQNQILTPPEVNQNLTSMSMAPEPSTGLLLGMGLIMLALHRRY